MLCKKGCSSAISIFFLVTTRQQYYLLFLLSWGNIWQSTIEEEKMGLRVQCIMVRKAWMERWLVHHSEKHGWEDDPAHHREEGMDGRITSLLRRGRHGWKDDWSIMVKKAWVEGWLVHHGEEAWVEAWPSSLWWRRLGWKDDPVHYGVEGMGRRMAGPSWWGKACVQGWPGASQWGRRTWKHDCPITMKKAWV